ncbi:MAG: hypothetical protein ACRDQB_04155 [Thermocrispum sp.]
MSSGRQRATPWDRLPTDPDDAAIWDRDGERFTGYLREWHLSMLRAQVEFVLALAGFRLAQHAEGKAGENLDARLDAVLELRRQTRDTEPSELELLIPMANRYRRVLEVLPPEGSKLPLPDFTARHDLGITALDLVQLLDRWLLALCTGEHMDDTIGAAAVEDFASLRDWLAHQIVTPLTPGDGDPAPRYGLS